MNSPILRYAVLVLLSVTIFASCKKSNPLHPYPSNYRISAFTEVSTTTPPALDTYFYQNYRFIYDDYGRVSQIIYSSNNQAIRNTISYLTYTGNTIYDTIRDMNYTEIEVDSFRTDLNGYITTTFMPGGATSYEYLNNLLSRVTYSSGAVSLFTSYDGNYLQSTATGGSVVNTTYEYYNSKDMYDRPGDFLQLQSFPRYGFNFFSERNLIMRIKAGTETTNVTYVFDANSRIVKTAASITDSVGAVVSTMNYDIQYETY